LCSTMIADDKHSLRWILLSLALATSDVQNSPTSTPFYSEGHRPTELAILGHGEKIQWARFAYI